MKKLLLLFPMLAITLFVSAYDFKVDGLCYKFYPIYAYNDTNSVAVTYEIHPSQQLSNMAYVSLPDIVEIPESVIYDGKAYFVTSIGQLAFSGCTGLTSIKIPNSVTSINGSAFARTGLTSVAIPNSVTTIGDHAFSGCSGLTSVTIPNSVTTIDEYAFYNCRDLKTAIIGENVISIANGVFSSSVFLENLVILRERPIIIDSNVFSGIPKASCDLHVRVGSKIRYENQDVWKDFVIILEDAEDYAEDYADVGGDNSGNVVYGDVNGDGVVTASDVTAIYNIILGNQ